MTSKKEVGGQSVSSHSLPTLVKSSVVRVVSLHMPVTSHRGDTGWESKVGS